MRPYLLLLATSLSVAASSGAMATPADANRADARGEINYPQGSLGYDALMRGDFATAEQQLLKGDRVARDDPARMLNMGYVHLRAGRMAEATRLFAAVRDNREHFAVELASGEVLDSRDVARRALRMMDQQIALR